MRRYAPDADAALATHLQHLDTHGLAYGVLVQPSFLGTDNRYMLQALRARPQRLRGVAVVDDNTGEDHLQALADAGVVGMRLNLIGLPLPDLNAPGWRRVLEQANTLGWHVELHLQAGRLPDLLPTLLAAGCRVVVDHFGRPDPALGVRDPGFGYLLQQAGSGRVGQAVRALPHLARRRLRRLGAAGHRAVAAGLCGRAIALGQRLAAHPARGSGQLSGGRALDARLAGPAGRCRLAAGRAGRSAVELFRFPSPIQIQETHHEIPVQTHRRLVGGRRLISAVAGMAAPAAAAAAANYPERPVTLVVTYPPGGTVDVVARLIGPRLSAELGQPVVIENRGGAGGMIGGAQVAKAQPDGYTLMLDASNHAQNPAIHARMQFDTLKAFAPVRCRCACPMCWWWRLRRPSRACRT